MTIYCEKLIRVVNVTASSEQVQRYCPPLLIVRPNLYYYRTQLSQNPEIIVSTPARILHHITTSKLSLKYLQSLVIDEADLVLSYGHTRDLLQISTLIPKTVQ